MKRYIFIAASILYVSPYQFNQILSGPDVAIMLSLILAFLVSPLAAFRQYVKQFPVLGRLFASLILFQSFYIIAFFFHGGLFPGEPLSDSLIRAARSIYPFLSMAIIALHVFAFPKFINIDPSNMVSSQAAILSLASILSVLNIFNCKTIYGGICLLNQSGYASTGFISLSSIILLLLSISTRPASSGLIAQIRKSLSIGAMLIFFILLIGAGSRAAVISLTVFVVTIIYFGFIKPLAVKGLLSLKYIIVFGSFLVFLVIYVASSETILRANRVFMQLLEDSDKIFGNARFTRYYSFDELISGATSFFGSGNFSYQPDPLGTSWYDGAYIWFQNNYGVPGLIALFILILSLLILAKLIVRTDSLSQKDSYKSSFECIISLSAIASFCVANTVQEVFALNTVSPFTIYVLSITAYTSLLKSNSRLIAQKYA